MISHTFLLLTTVVATVICVLFDTPLVRVATVASKSSTMIVHCRISPEFSQFLDRF